MRHNCWLKMRSVHVHNTGKKLKKNVTKMLRVGRIISKTIIFWFLIMKMKKIFKNGRFFARPWCKYDLVEITFFRNPGKCSFPLRKRPKWGPKILKSWYIIRDSLIFDRFLTPFLPRPLEEMKKNVFCHFWRFWSILHGFWGVHL